MSVLDRLNYNPLAGWGYIYGKESWARVVDCLSRSGESVMSQQREGGMSGGGIKCDEGDSGRCLLKIKSGICEKKTFFIDKAYN